MCEAGTTLLYIDNNGDAYPCPLFKSDREFLCGNVQRDDWREIWDAEPMKKLRAIPECRDCDYLCNVWCRAIKYFYNRKLTGRGLYCLKNDDET